MTLHPTMQHLHGIASHKCPRSDTRRHHGAGFDCTGAARGVAPEPQARAHDSRRPRTLQPAIASKVVNGRDGSATLKAGTVTRDLRRFDCRQRRSARRIDRVLNRRHGGERVHDCELGWGSSHHADYCVLRTCGHRHRSRCLCGQRTQEVRRRGTGEGLRLNGVLKPVRCFRSHAERPPRLDAAGRSLFLHRIFVRGFNRRCRR